MNRTLGLVAILFAMLASSDLLLLIVAARQSPPASPSSGFQAARSPALPPKPDPANGAPSPLVRQDPAPLMESPSTPRPVDRSAGLEPRLLGIEGRLEDVERALGEILSESRSPLTEPLDAAAVVALMASDGTGKKAPALVLMLVERGKQALEAITEALERGKCTQYGGKTELSGDRFGFYPDQRIALLDALRQIGTEGAQRVLAEELERFSERDWDFPGIVLARRFSSGPVFRIARRRFLEKLRVAGSRDPHDRSLSYWLEYAREHLVDDHEAFETVLASYQGMAGERRSTLIASSLLPAIAAMGGERGIAFLRETLHDDEAEPWQAATAAVALVDRMAADGTRFDFLCGTLRDAQLPIQTRLAIVWQTHHRFAAGRVPPAYVQALDSLATECPPGGDLEGLKKVRAEIEAGREPAPEGE